MNNEKKFIKLTPFKMQVLQSFPFIDEDFDAITNYELLCKVVEYLNKTVDNVDLLNEKVEEFQSYFDNLDVQEEVNKKLDEMAEDGTLAEIINQELFNELNGRISSVEENSIENPIFPAINNFGTHPKVVTYSQTNNTINVLQKTNSGYLVYELDNADGDTSAVSVGGSWEFIRLHKIQSCYKAYLAKTTFTTESEVTTLVAPSVTSSNNIVEQLLINNAKVKGVTTPLYGGTTIGAYGIPVSGSVTYTLNTRLKNKVNIMFLCLANASSNSDVTNIYLNDNLVDTIDLRKYSTAGNSIYIHEINVPYRPTSTTYTLKVENAGTNSKLTYVCCCNYVELDNYDGEDVDCFKAFMFNDYYINSGGSSDYAIYDTDINKWCGSYHGGETATAQRMTYPITTTIQQWKENYQITDISGLSDSWFITPTFRIEQTTNINDKGVMVSSLDFTSDGIIDMNFDFTGNINTTQFYTGLTAFTKDITIIKNPGNISTSSTGTYYLGQNNGYVQLNGAKKEACVLFDKYSSLNHTTDTKNGWLQNSQYYNKFYYGYVDNADGTPTNVTNLQFRKVLISKYL